MQVSSMSLGFAAILTLSALPGVCAARGQAPLPPDDEAAHAFDFLNGHRWRIQNSVLADRLAGSTEWQEFEGELFDVRPILGGYGNVDRFRARRAGKVFEGASIRIFDPSSGEWTIYWADTFGLRVTEQVRGTFQGGEGTFVGEETFKGQKVRMRFVWRDITERSARWEQAYWDEQSESWETNWVMVFTRLPTEDQ